MEKRTKETQTNNNFKKADGFLNVTLKLQDKAGNWHTIKGGIALHTSKAVERGLLNNPAILEDPERIEVSMDVHLIEADKDVEF